MPVTLRRVLLAIVALALAIAATAAGVVLDAPVPADAAGSTSRASVFVSNVDNDTVSVIDPATQTEYASIPVGDEPRNLAPTPDGSRVYVPNRHDNTVSVIDTATNTVLTTVSDAGFAEPYAVTVLPSGAFVYVANKTTSGGDPAAGSVTIIATATNTVTQTIDDACFLSPEGIVADPVRARVYVVNREDNIDGDYQVCFVDTTSNTVVDAVTVGDEPRYGVVTPNGAFLYTANNSSGDVTRIDLSDNSTDSIGVTGSPRNMALSNDGTKVYVALQTDHIAVIDVATGVATDITFTGMSSSYAVAILPGSSLGYVTDESNEVVFVFDTATDTEITGTGFPIESDNFSTPRAATAVGDPVVPPPPEPSGEVTVQPRFPG